MDWFEIVLSVIVFIVGGFVAYFGTKSSITSMVSYLIAQAEKTALTGSEKMQLVVSELYTKVPAVLKKLFTLETLEKIAQAIFDCMKEYAIEWANKQDEKEQADAMNNIEETPTI